MFFVVIIKLFYIFVFTIIVIMFITVNKITADNQGIITPKEEVIRVSDIKRFRSWSKSKDEQLIDGDVILISMNDKKDDIKIVESMGSFTDRLGPLVIKRLQDGCEHDKAE